MAIQYIDQEDADVILDALIGYCLTGNPGGWTKQIIEPINVEQHRVIALDVPSGLEAPNGKVFESYIRASATLTLALPKTGMRNLEASKVMETLYLADIIVPYSLYKELDLQVPQIFAQNTIVDLDINAPE